MIHTMTLGHCPTPENSPTYVPTNAVAATPAKPYRTEIWGILPDKKRIPCRWPTCLKKQPPRVAFKNNDIYMVSDEESDTYEEPKERHPRVLYKLKVSKDPLPKIYPMKKSLMRITTSPLMKQQYKDPPFWLVKYSVYHT